MERTIEKTSATLSLTKQKSILSLTRFFERERERQRERERETEREREREREKKKTT